MQVYKQEILDGVGEAVKATASVAFCSQASVCQDHVSPDEKIQKIVAANANPKQVDLYYIKSILVSTGWNKNDDVFDPAETFAARHTPEDKQFNFMHNENDIIGHITGSYVVDRSGNRLEAEEAPPQFDIITEAVLYNSWSDPDNRERMAKIIAEIEQGKWFVSMECLFAGFDYSVVSPDGVAKTVARNEESAFLTKHLRAYGGTGEYNGYKVGRSLRQISFSGKGLVNKPANPRSYIIDSSDESVHDNHEEHTFDFPIGDTIMAEDIKNEEVEAEVALASEVVETEVAEETVAEAAPEVTTEEATEVVAEEVAEEVVAEEAAEEVVAEEATEEVTDEASAECGKCGSEDHDTAECDKEEAKSEQDETIAALEIEKAELVAKIEALELELAGYRAKHEEEKKAKEMEKKYAALAGAGIEGEQAEAIIALSINDETFDAIVAALAAKVAKKEEETEDVKAEESLVSESSDDTAEAEAVADVEEVSEELFEEVSSTEATLIDASEDQNELDIARAAVSDWLTNNVLSK